MRIAGNTDTDEMSHGSSHSNSRVDQKKAEGRDPITYLVSAQTSRWVSGKNLFPEHLMDDGWVDGYRRCLNLDGSVPISDSVKGLKRPFPSPLPFLSHQPPFSGRGWDREKQLAFWGSSFSHLL